METEKLTNIINDISVNVAFTSCGYTAKQKTIMCQAFINSLCQFPSEMSKYLTEGTRGPSLQNKIYKNYLTLLEQSLPFYFIKGKEKIIINSLDDENLNLFTGKYVFEQTVNNQKKIKNNTSEIYIGGRKAAYVKPMYIGKLVDITNLDGSKSYLSKVKDYTFSYIKVEDLKPGTKVKVIHLGVPPHYQMGPMVYLNRIKKEIQKRIQNG